MTATDNDTRGSNAAPSSRSGLTPVVSAPATNPTGSKTMSAGMRNRLASTCEPTASTRIRPVPTRIWFVVTPAFHNATFINDLPAVQLQTDDGSRRLTMDLGDQCNTLIGQCLHSPEVMAGEAGIITLLRGCT